MYNEKGSYKMNIEDKLNLIKKHFKKAKLLLDIEMYNYEGCNIYIRLDYFKKERVHKVSWIDLNLLSNKNVKPYINSEYVSVKYLDNIAYSINNNNLSGVNYTDLDVNDGLVKLNLYFYEKKEMNSINILFHRYIPNELPFVFNIFANVFDNLPYKLEMFLKILAAKLNGEEEKYDHEKSFKLNLLKDDLDYQFKKEEVRKGRRCYSAEKIKFLEKINDKYYAVVEEKENHAVIVNYDKSLNETTLYCSCPCEFHCKHEYAVMLAIRNKEFNNFYKVAYDINTENVMEMVAGFKYFLCAGIKDDKLILLNNYGKIEYTPLFNEDGKVLWKVIEDDKKGTLKKEIDKIIKKEYL